MLDHPCLYSKIATGYNGGFMNSKSTLLPGMVEWTLAQKNPNNISCSFGCGFLFLDVCGFTKLTEKVSAKGHYGVEVITNLLNQYFNLLNDKIIQYGGQILKFEGDAILAAFAIPEKTCLAQMQICMEEFRGGLDFLNNAFRQEYGSELAYHGSMGFGQSQMIILGNPEKHLDYFVYSSIMGDLYHLCELAGHNETLVVKRDNAEKSILTESCKKTAQPTIPQFADQDFDQSFFPSEILERGQSETFSGELRNSAILFIGVNAEEFIQEAKYEEINRYYSAIQEIVYHLEGMVNKIDYTDKGMILLISFGILQTHVDDIERAILAAHQINRLDSPLKAKIGLTYSNLYAGILGAKNRHEYGIIGGGVNVAARLMSSAEYGQIVFTKDILGNAESRFEAKFLRKTLVKGIKEELEFYLIVRELPEHIHSYIKQFNDKLQVSYLTETAHIITQIAEKKLNQVIIYGEHGTGKSFIGWQILKEFYDQGCKLAVFVLDEYNQHDRLVLLRKLICKGLQCEDPLANPERLKTYVANLLEEHDLENVMQALGAVSQGNKLADEGGKQKDLMLESLLKCFEGLIAEYDYILIDNIQWLDDLSSQILNKRLGEVDKKPQTLVLTHSQSQNSERKPAVLNSRTSALHLGDLEHEQVNALICSRIPNVTHQAGDFIYDLAGGNPRFVVELCNQINSLYPEPDTLITMQNIQDIQNKGLLPYSVENLFMIKYEALSAEAKDILKKASIIGKGFTLKEIIETQEGINQSAIYEVFNELKERDIIYVTDLSPELQYLFSNALMRQAVYSTILLTEKKDLHNRIAMFYEDKFADRAMQHSELIAYHYHLGENQAKALSYSLQAACQNQAISNHGEALYYFQIALQNAIDPLQKASIRLCSADSQFYLGEFEAAKASLDAVPLPDLKDAEELGKYHYLRSRALYLAGDYEGVLHYLEQVADFNGLCGEQTRLYQLDCLYKLYRIEEFMALQAKLKQDYATLAAKALHSKAKSINSLLNSYIKLSAEKRTPVQKHYLYLLLKLEAVATLNLSNTGRYKEAEKSLLLQYDIAKGIKDDLSLRISSNSLGIVYGQMGKLDKAYKAYVEAIGIADKIGDRFGFAKVLCDLGTLHRRMGEHKKALQNFNRSLKIFEALGNLSFQGTVLHGIGEMYHWEEKHLQAQKYYRKALKIAKLSGDLFGVSIEQDGLGDIQFLQGNYPQAKQIYLKNLKLQEKIGDIQGIAHTYGNLGNLAKKEQDYPLAIKHYLKNIELTASVADTDGNGKGYFNLASVYQEMGNNEKLIENLRIAMQRFEQAGSTQLIEMTRKRLADLGAM